MTEVIRLDQVSLWRRTQEEFSYDLKKTVLSFLEGKYRKPARKLVLDRIDIKVESGEKVGIIGANGSGKSTLLKVISGILKPTAGQVRVRGQIAPLIELGAGFDPDISVMDNIILYGVLLGFSREEMKQRATSILDFAELEEYARIPVKALSSGMVARLGFAIATDIQPDILILDEVLSVGDESFKNKCKQRMEKFWDANATILIVSHDLQFVRKSCQRVIWLDQGQVKFSGQSDEVVQLYLDSVTPRLAAVIPTPEPEHVGVVEPLIPTPEHVGVIEPPIPTPEPVAAIESVILELESEPPNDEVKALPTFTPIPRVLTAFPCSGTHWFKNIITQVMGQVALERRLQDPSELMVAMHSEASQRLLYDHFDFDIHGSILTPANYPDLRMILLYRNPLDALIANFYIRASGGTLPDNTLSPQQNLKLFIRGYWSDKQLPDSIRTAMPFSMSLRDFVRRCLVDWCKSGYCLPIRYEDLVANPQKQVTILRLVMDYLGVQHSPETVEAAINRNRFDMLSSCYYHSPENSSLSYWIDSLEKWRQVFDSEDLAVVNNQIGDYLEFLGYPLSP
jgi:ABC-2 type transport system ATP-binding protein/lipopolysaccharide transport system ATP-binding protein